MLIDSHVHEGEKSGNIASPIFFDPRLSKSEESGTVANPIFVDLLPNESEENGTATNPIDVDSLPCKSELTECTLGYTGHPPIHGRSQGSTTQVQSIRLVRLILKIPSEGCPMVKSNDEVDNQEAQARGRISHLGGMAGAAEAEEG